MNLSPSRVRRGMLTPPPQGMSMNKLAALALAAAGLAASGCSLIDENAELDPRVMETPGVDTVREANYPPGSAQPNPEL
jgi:hypothetical protein